MPLATPTAIDNWSTNHASNHARSSAIAPNKQETPRVSSTSKAPTLIGQSPVMKKLFSVIERVAPTDASVLITGATGTGKTYVACALAQQADQVDQASDDAHGVGPAAEPEEVDGVARLVDPREVASVAPSPVHTRTAVGCLKKLPAVRCFSTKLTP